MSRPKPKGQLPPRPNLAVAGGIAKRRERTVVSHHAYAPPPPPPPPLLHTAPIDSSYHSAPPIKTEPLIKHEPFIKHDISSVHTIYKLHPHTTTVYKTEPRLPLCRPPPTPPQDQSLALPIDLQNRSTVAKQRPKQYKRPTPSKFCHVCGRKSHNVTVAVCARIEDGMCRKVVCEFCFDKYGWDRSVLDQAGAKAGVVLGGVRTSRWTCTHCRGRCVAKAQCNTYGRTNYKRHLKLRQRRCVQPPSSAASTASGSTVDDAATMGAMAALGASMGITAGTSFGNGPAR